MTQALTELIFQRAAINLKDAARLGEGEDLNDALLDFFIRLGQHLIPKKKNDKAKTPVAFLGALFFKQLTSQSVNSGEEGWQQVQKWGIRKAGNIFSDHYGGLAVAVNEDLKDEDGKEAGNHWWCAIVLNPPGGALKEPTGVLLLDSMQRRDKRTADGSAITHCAMDGSGGKYTCKIEKVEQAGYLLIISFDARGDGSRGAIMRPEGSRLYVDGYELRGPSVGLNINLPGNSGVAGRFNGTITFELDGRCRSSVFELGYASHGYPKMKLEFDPFLLTKFQKKVTRFLGGYLSKEWAMNGPADKKKKYMLNKQAARALTADCPQQENINDCGVFVMENILRSLAMEPGFLKRMAQATPEVLAQFPWPTQQEITARKIKLKNICTSLFAAAAKAGTTDVEKILNSDSALKKEVLSSLTEDKTFENVDTGGGDLKKELAKAQKEQDEKKARLAKEEEEKQAEKAAKEERKAQEARKKKEKEEEEDRKQFLQSQMSSSSSESPPRRQVRAERKDSRSRSGNAARNKASAAASNGRGKRRRAPSQDSRDSRSPSPPPQKRSRRETRDDSRTKRR